MCANAAIAKLVLSVHKLFTDHPKSVGETYPQHLHTASWFGCQMLKGGCGCLIHAVAPFAFKTAGSDTIRRLYDAMIVHRHSPRQAD